MKFTTLLPLRDNDGNDLTANVYQIIDALSVQFGGCSIEALVEGRWTDKGIEYRDQSVKVSVICENSRYLEARNHVHKIGKELRQLAMYFEVQLDDGVEIMRIE